MRVEGGYIWKRKVGTNKSREGVKTGVKGGYIQERRG